MTFSKIVSGNESESKYSAIFKGTDIPDGKYKINIRAVKNTSGSFGSRVVNFGKENSSYVINYKYPIPQPTSDTNNYFHFFDVYYDYERGRNKVRYALELNYQFDDDIIADGIEIKVNDNGTDVNPITLERGNSFKVKYIPLLEKDGKNNFTFNFQWHDFQDNLKREDNFETTWQTPVDINDAYRDSYVNGIDLEDDLIKSYGDEWTEISPDESNTDFEEKYITFDVIKEKTLKYIPRSLRKKATIKDENDNEITYSFFCENEYGPYYRKRNFKRRNVSEITFFKRYDSIPYNIKTGGFETLYTNLTDCVKISSTKYYDKTSNTMGLNLTLKFKDLDGSALPSNKIDYGMLYIYNENDFSEPKLSFDVSDVDNSGSKNVSMSGLNIGNYIYKLITYNEACCSDNNTLESDIISVKPNADDTMSTSYEILEDDIDDSKFKIYINWKTYLKDISGLSLVLQKKNTSGKYTTYATYPMNIMTHQNNASFTTLAAGNYKYFFTFSSDSCIFNKNKRVKETEIVVNSSAITN